MGAVRLFLSLGVVLAHTGSLHAGVGLPTDFWPYMMGFIGGASVLYFYIVSGFLMSYVLNAKYPPGAAGTTAFYRARFIRIYPLWLAVAAFAIAAGPHPWPGPHPAWQSASAISLLGSDWMVAFADYPSKYFAAFPSGTEVGWTLGAELTFYAVAPFLLRSKAIAAAALAASVLVRVVVCVQIDRHAPAYHNWSYFFFPATLMYFLLGHFGRLVASRLPLLARYGAVLIIVAGALSSRRPLGEIDNAWLYVSAVCFALGLPSLFALTSGSRVLNFLGDLTYPLYLTHSLGYAALFSRKLGTVGLHLVSIAKHLDVSPALQSTALSGLLAAVLVLVAVLVHFVVERPVSAVFDRTLRLLPTWPVPAPAH